MKSKILSLFTALAVMLVSFSLPAKAAESSPLTVTVSARSAILIDADNCRILYEKNPYERLPMASTTKIMTALLVLDLCQPDEIVTVTPETVGIEGSSVYLRAGEKLTVLDLLYALMLASANDAAVTLAHYVGGSVEGFAHLMNKKASELGLENTHFVTPNGLDAKDHHTTAYDLARLTAHALRNPDFVRIVSTYKHTVKSTDGGNDRYLVNHNKLLRSYDGAIGVKTGYTKKCGRCLVSAAKRNGLTLVAVTLADPDDWRDHKCMLDYGFAHYKSIELAKGGQQFYSIPVINGGDVPLIAKTDLAVTMIQHGSDVTSTVECPRFLWKYPKNGEVIGHAVFNRDGKTVGIVELVAVMPYQNENHRFGFFDIFEIFGIHIP